MACVSILGLASLTGCGAEDDDEMMALVKIRPMSDLLEGSRSVVTVAAKKAKAFAAVVLLGSLRRSELHCELR